MLNLDLDQKLQIEPRELIGKMVAVLGITRSGKTNTAAVLIEELAMASLPMTILDVEGEYWGLKERLEILVAGKSEHVDLEVAPEQAGELARLVIGKGISIVLDVSEFDKSEQFAFLLEYFRALWEANFTARKPHAVFLEEAHEFVPQLQSSSQELKDLLTRFALRGAKRGFSVVVMSQRSSRVSKDVLTQASLLFLHKVVHPADKEVYKDLIPLPAKEVESLIGGLQRGQALVLHDHEVIQTQIRLRHTLHVGATPELGLAAPVNLKTLDLSLLTEFKQSIKKPAKNKIPDRANERELAELKRQVTTLTAENASLKERVRELSTKAQPTVVIHNNPVAVAKAEAISSSVAFTSAESARLTKLVKQIKAVPGIRVNPLKFVLEQYPRRLDTDEIARELKMLETSVITSFRFNRLENIGFIYRDVDAVILDESYFKERFPGREPSYVIRLLAEAL